MTAHRCRFEKEKMVTLYARIEEAQYDALRGLAFRKNTSISAVVGEMFNIYLESKRNENENNSQKGKTDGAFVA
jgi:hypothetical protein